MFHSSRSFARSRRRGPGGRFTRSTAFRPVGAPRRRSRRMVRLPAKISSRAFRRGNIRSAGRLKAELKTRDLNLTTAVPISFGDLLGGTPVNGVSQGTSENQRIGNRIITKRLQVTGTVAFDPADTGSTTAGDFNNVVKIVWGVDHQCNGAILNPADVYDDVNSTATWRNLDHSDRFTILKVLRFARTCPIASSAGGNDEKVGAHVDIPFEFFIPMSMVTKYEGTGASVTDITDNHIFCLGVKEDTLCNVNLTQRIRMRYTG